MEGESARRKIRRRLTTEPAERPKMTTGNPTQSQMPPSMKKVEEFTKECGLVSIRKTFHKIKRRNKASVQVWESNAEPRLFIRDLMPGGFRLKKENPASPPPLITLSRTTWQ